eukprot:5077080-Pyramimonas_sp.AAC.1
MDAALRSGPFFLTPAEPVRGWSAGPPPVALPCWLVLSAALSFLSLAHAVAAAPRPRRAQPCTAPGAA